MPQTTASAAALKKIKYIDQAKNSFNMRTPGLMYFQREGDDMPTAATETDWGLVTQRNHNSRTVGANDPQAFPTNTGKLGYSTIKVTYVKTWTPVRLTHEVFKELSTQGAFIDAATRELQGVIEEHAFNMERQFWTSDGRQPYFRVKAGSAGVGPTFLVDRYGGYTGEELGVIMESLNLVGAQVNAAPTIGAADSNGGVPGTISSYVKTKGAESITLSGALTTGWLDNDFIYPSRQDNLGVTGATDGFFGLPALVDDGTLLPTFQNITIATVPTWGSTVLGAGGVKRPLTEDILSQAVTIARMRGGGVGTDPEDGFVGSAFFCSRIMYEGFAQSLSTYKEFSAKELWNVSKGFKPIAGPDIESAAYQGIGFAPGILALRNDCFLVNTKHFSILHNGPFEGSWFDYGMGDEWLPVANSTQVEAKRWTYAQFAAEERSSSVRISDLTTTSAF